ncbi:MAG: CehA/McbA family metallohydrolase [Polyangiales bacterium]
MARIEQLPDRYLHSPRLTRGPAGGAVLHLIAWEPAGERVVRFDVSRQGEVAPCDEDPHVPAIVALRRGDVIEPAGDESELEESRAGERVWAELRDGIASVHLARASGDVLVFRARGSAVAPTLAVTPEGTWVAFHHDVREDDGASDVAKWIALRFVDGAGRVLEVDAPMRERDRDREGVEQSFEFPALGVGPRGALALFGRGSHNFWRQDVDGDGFSARVPLSDGEWGSRGRHIVACALDDGLVVARRDRKGVEVDVLALPRGAAPVLVPARVDWVTPFSIAPEHRVDPASARGLVTLFGDIQQHSAHSDGVGSADEVYQRARYRYGDDFVALTDHESFLGKRTGPGEWEYLQRVADRHDAPGKFTTLLAYEWTGKMFPGPGHKCVYYPRRGVPIVSRDEVPVGRELVARVRALGGFASPHHIGWTGADAEGHDDAGQPLWEICSCHGCYEHPAHPLGARGELREQTVDVMLRRGLRFGFTASSDSHGLLWHHGEARKRDPYRTGLTAVQARACTRDEVMDALVSRRCYATSGAKIRLDLDADGAPMGSVLDTRMGGEVSVQVVGTAPIARIELVGPGGTLAHTMPSAREGSLTARVGGAFVYARVVQEDGEMAWSSPVFFGEARRHDTNEP